MLPATAVAEGIGESETQTSEESTAADETQSSEDEALAEEPLSYSIDSASTEETTTVEGTAQEALAALDAADDGSTDDASAESTGSTQLETLSSSTAAYSTKITTKTTYSLSLASSTAATSSSDTAIRKLVVTRPKITKTVKRVVVETNATTGTSKTYTTTTSTSTKTYSLSVKVSIAGVGWKKASLNSAGTKYSYTAASGKYIQAVCITPSSALKSALKTAGISFYYRASSKYLGTLGWAKAAQIAGSTGQACAMKKFTLKIASAIPGSSENHYISQPIVTYKVKKVGNSSFQSSKSNGSTAGSTTSSSYNVGILAAKIATTSSPSGSLKYSVRATKADSSSSWKAWKSNYASSSSGVYGLRAVRMKLTGDMADYYDVYYRVYVRGYGWLGWACNGQKAGLGGLDGYISAIQIKLVVAGKSAPGSTSYHYVTSSDAKMKMVLKAQSYSSSTSYLILVNRSTCRVGIFTGAKGNWTLKHYWQCCVGKSSTPTVSGSFTVGSKGYSFGTSSYTCYYYTQFYGNYLFHSVLYYAGTKKIKDGTMGKAVSHGCVRLTIEHAKWIYDTIPRKTKVRVY